MLDKLRNEVAELSMVINEDRYKNIRNVEVTFINYKILLIIA